MFSLTEKMSDSEPKKVVQVGRKPMSDNTLRWVLVEIVLNTVLSPKLRELVDQQLKKYYDQLKNSHKIDSHDDETLSNNTKLEYGSLSANRKEIVNSAGRDNSYKQLKQDDWNFAVKDRLELARLHLKPVFAWYFHISKFKANFTVFKKCFHLVESRCVVETS